MSLSGFSLFLVHSAGYKFIFVIINIKPATDLFYIQ